jgi:UDP-N-acetylglucosamine 2-epimerase (non-hydrolysing)
MVVYGTRPEAIKLAPLTRALQNDEACEPIVVSTGQHSSLLRDTNVAMGAPVALEFSIIREGQSITRLTEAALQVASQAFRSMRPDVVLVHGDTTTALAAALAAHYEQLPVVHAEAGLRTKNQYLPFPEEMNRRLISQIAELHLAPTSHARKNLLTDGIPPADIVVTGNLVVDALLEALDRRPHFTDHRVEQAYRSKNPIIMFTMHRRESWGSRMTELAAAISAFCRARPDITLIVPMHPNPTVRASLTAGLGSLSTALLCEPLGYDEFVHLMHRSAAIVTDSGGIQEEAVTLRRTVLVLRDDTERPEGITEGFLRVVGRNPRRLDDALHEALDAVGPPGSDRTSPVYGDGKAAQRCLSAITARWRGGARIADFTAVG